MSFSNPSSFSFTNTVHIPHHPTYTSSSSEDEEGNMEDFDIIQNAKQKRLEELMEPISNEYSLDKEIRRLECMTCFVGASSVRINRYFRIVAYLLWIFSISFHFSSDFYEAYEVYGFAFLTSQVVWLFAFVLLTWATAFRSLPWFETGLKELRRDGCFEKTVTKIVRQLKRVPLGLLLFGMSGAGIQHALLYADGAMHVDFHQDIQEGYRYALHVARFVTGTHIYFAYGLFWVIPTFIMLSTGYAMTEFMDQMGAKMKDKQRLLAFKEAIGTYSTRAKFVKTSSSKSFVVLTTLMITGVVCFGLNAYIFLFHKRRYLHVWHSVLPMFAMVYPLCTAAWVTKQYTWFIIVVVRAWVHRDDLDESSSEDSGIDDNEKLQTSQTSQTKKFFNTFNGLTKLAHKSPRVTKRKLSPEHLKLKKNMSNNFVENSRSKSLQENHSDASISQSTGVINQIETNLLPWQKKVQENDSEAPSLKRSFAQAVGAAKAVTKFRLSTKKLRFNFEKFLSYLESMRSVVGFQIAGIMVTWNLVSTLLFLLFSILAVFLQESIFGSQRSTLE